MIQSSPTLNRIYSIMLSLRGQMIPSELILSSETYRNLLTEANIRQEIDSGKPPTAVLESYFSIPIAIREENTDVIIVKELFPNPCPVCNRRIPFLREMIERIESHATNRIRCPLGHRYEGEIKIYHLNIFQTAESPETRTFQSCPQCGSKNIQHLSQRDVFCLDCEWDNMKRI